MMNSRVFLAETKLIRAGDVLDMGRDSFQQELLEKFVDIKHLEVWK